MNIFPPVDHATSAPAAPADWTIDVGIEKTAEGIAYFADVKRAGRVMCRIVHAGAVHDDAAARKLLADKARVWINDFLVRDAQAREL